MGPELAVPRTSLITSADDASPDANDTRWYQSFQVYAEGCPVFETYPICPSEDEDAKDQEKADTENPWYYPYIIYSWDNCSSWGFSTRDAWGRANRKELVSESFLLEQQLWTDSLGLSNPNLQTLAVDVTADAANQAPLAGLAQLDQELGEANIARGMIHVRPRVLAYFAQTRAIRREGNLWLTPMDNIVVGGRGYPGTGPADQAPTAATEWIYASSGIVQIRRSPVQVVPDYNDFAAAMERPNNDIIVRSERVVHAALDPNCGVWAFNVDLADAF